MSKQLLNRIAKRLNRLGIDYAKDKANPTEEEILSACRVFQLITAWSIADYSLKFRRVKG